MAAVRPRTAPALVVALALATVLAGCAGGGGDQNPGSRTATPLPRAAARSASSAAAPATLVLYVSNQSFDDSRVRIRVSVDGALVVNQVFDVGGQHNWVSFPLVLPAGDRRVEAVAETGVRTTQTATLPAGQTRYAVVDYWDSKGEPKELTWHFSQEPIAFD